MNWELFTYVIWAANVLIIIILFIIFLRKQKIKKKVPETDVQEPVEPEKLAKKKVKVLDKDERQVISKLAVFGGYSGIAKEKLMGLTGMESNNLSHILNNLEIRDIINQGLSDSEKVELCKWVPPLLKDVSGDRELNTIETHTLNVVCMLKEEDNITQKELGRRAKVPPSTLSEVVIPLLENHSMVERVSVGSGKLVRLIK
ncbi:hypothetical protein BEH94_03120 [Candidatus Altiarchaeales archaeon WOR_SM1_SCG]|nr:hypothetical protein BEH94_03120 [Candidatus Altiarchaeales archaeon WOR_SM1_SCG]